MGSLPSGFSRGAAQAHYSASVSKYFQCVALSTGSLEKIGQQLKMELIVCLLKRPNDSKPGISENNQAEDSGRQLMDLLCLLLLDRARIR